MKRKTTRVPTRRSRGKGMPKTGDTVTVNDPVNFVCPFCSLNATASLDPPSIFHALPMCDEFTNMDIVSYMRAVNARAGDGN